MQTDLLANPATLSKDLGLVSNAIRRFGDRLREAGPELVDRLTEIVAKRTVSTLNADGDHVEVESLADDNAMRAAEILLRAVSIDQKDDHHTDKMLAPKTQPSIAIQVNTGGGVATTSAGGGRASAVAERIRLRRLSERSAGGDLPASQP